jgi:hypothetical protein
MPRHKKIKTIPEMMDELRTEIILMKVDLWYARYMLSLLES